MKRQALERHLRRSIQGEVRFDDTSRRLYSTDASIYQIQPLGVVIPQTAEDLRVTIQIAAEHHTPIVPRGGGTSLSGQSIGAGVVVDCSKYLNRILDVDPSGRRVRVQPGVILEQLNRVLEPHGLWFGPDVATASRANLGGMIGNNSAGARSIVYGKTSDHVHAIEAILSDGTAAHFEPVNLRTWDRKGYPKTLEGHLYHEVKETVLAHEAEIRARFPKILRRVSGYGLDVLLEQFEGPKANLASLLVGSEGTLAFVAEAELTVVPRPKHRGLLLPHFDSLVAALDSLAICLEFQPSAVELLDQMILDLARENLALRQQMAGVQGRPAVLFMVEFSSDDAKEVADRIDRLARRLHGTTGMGALVKAVEPEVRDAFWNLRSAAVPLLLGVPGDRKPVTFVEDTAVAPERLPEFAARFKELLHRHGTDGSFYGHASVGCLHIRPVLDLKRTEDVARMRRITEDVTDLVLSFGGSLSGEHGDGLARSEWNRKMFGEEIHQTFRHLKRVFDPLNLFNPGKVVDAPAMTEHLRLGPGYHAHEPGTLFDYSHQEGFARSIELCNGSGVCRKLQGGTMCPSFRATRDERDSTRGRANALRLALAEGVPSPLTLPLTSSWLHDVLDLCLMCKACKAECPSNVDMAKLKAEFLHLYHQANPRPFGQAALTRVHRFLRLAAPLAPIANWLGHNRPTRWLLEKLAGIDRRRSLPTLRARHLRRWFRRHKPERGTGRAGRVLLLDDCFTTYSEPQIGEAAVRVLERAGYQVELAKIACCGRPMISKGFLPEARKLIARQVHELVPRLANGTTILGLEPSCILTLADEWPELVPGPDARRVAHAAQLADAWLTRQLDEQRCSLEFSPKPGRCVVHGHCHQKALVGMDGTVGLLRRIPGLDVRALDTGCCGMAGLFGYEREHFDLSVAIARLALLPELENEPDALVVAPGTSCRHQIKDLAHRRGWHPFELVAEFMR
jgi:FAD/FMN-containing dehydrogenase/Fe-S oxidoreductase